MKYKLKNNNIMAVEIEWIDSISPAATGNKIYRDTVPPTGKVEVADIANGNQIYQDDTAEVGTGVEYKYVIQAHDGAGDETTQEVEGENMDYITTAGGVNNPYVFDGNATSYLQVDQTNILDGVIAQSWVVKAKVTAPTNVIRSFINTNANNAGLQFRISATNLVDTYLSGTGATSLTNLAWSSDELEHTFIFTYDGTNIDVFEDGVSIGTKVDPDFVARPNGETLVLGKASGAATYFGEITDIQFYNRGLTQTEVTNLSADITDLPADNGTSLVANFAGNKTASTWTSEVGGFTATNQGGVTLG